jgi:LEA14-like dessication related protein
MLTHLNCWQSRAASLAAVVVVASTLLPACAPKPTGVEDWRITALNLQKVDTAYNLKLQNTNPFPWPILEVKGKVLTQDREIAQMQLGQGELGSIPAMGEAAIPMTASMPFAQLVQALQGTNLTWGSEVPFTAKAIAVVKLPGDRRMELPEIALNGVIPILAPPTASLDGAPTFTEQTQDRCRCQIKLKVNNPNKFALTLRSLDGSLKLKKLGTANEFHTLSALSLADAAEVPAQGSKTLTFNADFVPKSLFNAPAIPASPSGNPLTNPTKWGEWASQVIQLTFSGSNPPPASINASAWTNWAQGLVGDWWTKALDGLDIRDNYKASVSAKFRTPHAPFDIPLQFGE